MTKNCSSKFTLTGRSSDLPRGRGAHSNRSGRYDVLRREKFDDGWRQEGLQNIEGLNATVPEAPPLKTEVTIENPRKIISRNNSPDISFDRSINPYRGCEHGCIYCYARPTHAYMDLSPGLDFESKLFAKPNAAALLRQELSHPKYAPRFIALGSNTDPYQPVERGHKITRSVLEVLAETNHPVGIVTKSDLVLRDLDILAPMADKGLAKVALSITTLDAKLARAMEPRATTPGKRLEAVHQLGEAGIPTSVLIAPVIPALNDVEIETILETVQKAGADSARYIAIRLPLEIKDLFQEWLMGIVPDRANHIMSLIRDMRGGKAYESAWGLRQRGRGAYADLIRTRFEKATKRLGLVDAGHDMRTDLFEAPRPPPTAPDADRRAASNQLSFLF